MKRMKSLFFAIVVFSVFISAFTFLPQSVMAVEDTRIIYVDFDKEEFATKISSHIAPQYDGYLFAGWVNKSSSTVISQASEIGESDDVAAKFMRADMSRIACQLNLTDEETPSKRNMRMVSIIDSVNYRAVGFNVYGRRASDGVEWLMYGYGVEGRTAQSTKEYSGLKKYTSDVEFTIITPSDVFGSEAEGYKFTTVQISNIPSTYFDAIIMARPYWITKDGTYVEGLGEFNRISDGTPANPLDRIVNITVNIKQATTIAGGMLNVSYDKTKFEYQGADYGRVFSKMRFSDSGNAVKCTGVVTTASNTANPNDAFVNLRFKRKVSLAPGVSTFSVSDLVFCDIDETFQTVNAPSVKY